MYDHRWRIATELKSETQLLGPLAKACRTDEVIAGVYEGFYLADAWAKFVTPISRSVDHFALQIAEWEVERLPFEEKRNHATDPFDLHFLKSPSRELYDWLRWVCYQLIGFDHPSRGLDAETKAMADRHFHFVNTACALQKYFGFGWDSKTNIIVLLNDGGTMVYSEWLLYQMAYFFEPPARLLENLMSQIDLSAMYTIEKSMLESGYLAEDTDA